MGFDNTAYGGQYQQAPPSNNPPPPSYEQSMTHYNPNSTPSTPTSNNNNGLDRNSNMNASFTSTSSSATMTQSMSDSFIKHHQLDTKYHPNDQAYDTTTGNNNLINLRPQEQNQPPLNLNYIPHHQTPNVPQHLQNQVVYPTLNPQQQPTIPLQQPYQPMNHYNVPQQPYHPPQQTLPPLPQKTQQTMTYQKPNTIPQHVPVVQPMQRPVIPMQQPMMIPPQQPYIHPQPMMVNPQPVVVTQRTVTQTYNTPIVQPVFVSSTPVVTQVPGRTTTVVTTTTPNMVPPVRVVHGPPPSMPSGAVGYSAYYPQHSVPVSQTTVYVQQKKKKSLFDKFVHGE